MQIMPEKSEDTVVLRVEVAPSFRARLKAAAARAEKTMGEFLETIAEDPLREFEVQVLESTKPEKVKK